MVDRSGTSDEDFEFGDESYLGEIQQHKDEGIARKVSNQPHDEEVNISDSDSLSGAEELSAKGLPDGSSARGTLQSSRSQEDSKEVEESNLQPKVRKISDEDQDTKTSELLEYNAQDYKNLNVTSEIRDLFKYIGRYKGQAIELDTKLKPFIPDYIPAVGDIDEFIKVPRPDGKEDFLGLKVLDEPGPVQSDPTILNLQLRQHSKQARAHTADVTVGRVDHRENGKDKKINKWIQNITDIHKKQPPASVLYSKPMPDIETLMQEWPREIEQHIKAMKFPSEDLKISLDDFTRIICNILDIPVYDNPIESLHVLFTLFLEFRNNPNLQQQSERGDPGVNILTNNTPEGTSFH